MSSPPHGTKTFPVGAWVLDPAGSRIIISVRSLLVSSVKLTVRIEEGLVSVDDFGVIRHLEIRVAAASVDSGNARRDKHLRSADFLDSDMSPFITYSGSSTGDVIDGVAQVKDHNAALRLRATEATVSDDGIATFAAHGTIDRRLLGLDRLPSAVIGNQLTVALRGVARAAS
ncbi:MAG: YceI family protein [Ornithinimicrobium sp.]